MGIYLSIKSNKKKDPVYSIKSINVISDYSSKYNNLTVAYKRKKVENFTVSKVLFYNRGAETIDRQNLTTKHHVRVVAVECQVLDARLLQANNLSSDFKVEVDKLNGWVNIDFDYLNTNHGAVFEVIHTGTNSENIALVGDIKGVQKLEQVLPDKLRKNEPVSTRTCVNTDEDNPWCFCISFNNRIVFANFPKRVFDKFIYSISLVCWSFWIDGVHF